MNKTNKFLCLLLSVVVQVVTLVLATPVVVIISLIAIGINARIKARQIVNGKYKPSHSRATYECFARKYHKKAGPGDDSIFD